MFTGPAGVGKFAVARATAAVLNCSSPQQDHEGLAVDACGICRSCDRIGRSLHVDVLAVEPDERASIKIDVVRDVLERTGYRPFEGQRRVVIIRDADTLEVAAQNALAQVARRTATCDGIRPDDGRAKCAAADRAIAVHAAAVRAPHRTRGGTRAGARSRDGRARRSSRCRAIGRPRRGGTHPRLDRCRRPSRSGAAALAPGGGEHRGCRPAAGCGAFAYRDLEKGTAPGRSCR